jgi:hypothetical protein
MRLDVVRVEKFITQRVQRNAKRAKSFIVDSIVKARMAFHGALRIVVTRRRSRQAAPGTPSRHSPMQSTWRPLRSFAPFALQAF